MGGFYLKDSAPQEIERIINELKHLGVTHVAPTHCSGKQAEELFVRIFGANSQALCPGSVVQL